MLFYVGNQAIFLKNINSRASSLQESRKGEKNKAVFLQFLRSVPDTFWPVSYFFCGHYQSVCMGKILVLQIGWIVGQEKCKNGNKGPFCHFSLRTKYAGV